MYDFGQMSIILESVYNIMIIMIIIQRYFLDDE